MSGKLNMQLTGFVCNTNIGK